MTKRGKPYERVVAEVLRVGMEPGASVKHGVWVKGPDGRRDMDVSIEGVADGQPRKVLIECKDFNPNKTGPVGIGYVDALESKRRDIGADVSFICSNAGFTSSAISKARRVGIGLISVMRKGDKRVRFAVADELYTRRVKVEKLTIGLTGPEPIDLTGVPFDGVLFQGVPVANWVVHRTMLLLGANPIVNGTYTATHQLKDRTILDLPSGPVAVTAISFHLTISGGWFAQQITIDATAGFYDWLRRRVRLAPGPGQLHLQGVDLHKGTPITAPPDSELQYMKDLRHGEVTTALMELEGLEVLEPIPDLDPLIEPDDLECTLPEVPPEAYTSTRPQPND